MAAVLGKVGACSHAAVFEAVENGGDAEGAGRGPSRGGEDVAGGDQRGAEAVVREAAAELEHRVGVALCTRYRQEQHVRAAAGVGLLVGGGSGGGGGGRRGGAGARAPHGALVRLASCVGEVCRRRWDRRLNSGGCRAVEWRARFLCVD